MRAGPAASRELLDRLRHVDFIQPEDAFAHHAVLELTADGGGRVEETFHAFDQRRVGRRINGGVAGVHYRSGFVQLLLRLQQNERGAGGGAGGANRLIDVLERVRNVSVDAGRKLADTRLQHTLCEVIELHGQLSGREVHADVLLARHRKSGELFLIVLDLQRGTVGHQRAVRQTDTQRGTDFCALNGERVVVGSIDITGDHQVVLEDLERLAGDHVNRKD